MGASPDSSTRSPPARAESTSRPSSLSRAEAGSSGTSSSARSTSIMVRISASDWMLFSRTDLSTVRTVSGSRAAIDSTASDWMAIADRCPAITSCRSRAIRVRSAVTAARRSSCEIRSTCSVLSRCCRRLMAHHTGMTSTEKICSPDPTALRQSCTVSAIPTAIPTAVITTRPMISWLVRLDPRSVATCSRSISTMITGALSPSATSTDAADSATNAPTSGARLRSSWPRQAMPSTSSRQPNGVSDGPAHSS